MNFLKSFRLKHGEEAVSPVVGVMLMLVVTIIIAAVVSAFAGGLATSTPKAPTLAMDTVIQNDGTALNSFFSFTVQSVSEPIPTSDLKITTSWQTTCKYTSATDIGSPCTAVGQTISGGNTTQAGLNAPNVNDGPLFGGGENTFQDPLGFGVGITNQQDYSPYPTDQQFGNYTLVAGVTMKDSPIFTTTNAGYGLATPYVYDSTISTAAPGYLDGVQAVLGGGWENLRPGDIVNVKVTDTRAEKVIYNQNVAVTG